MKSLAALILLAASSAVGASERLTIEVQEETSQFRIRVETDTRTTIIPWELEPPHGGFPPRAAGVLVQDSRGNTIGCGVDNAPSYPAESTSSSASVKDLEVMQIVNGQEVVTPWFEAQSLFFQFDGCVMPDRRGGYVNYQIVAHINTKGGPLTARTGWMPIRGFEPHGQGVDVPQEPAP